MPQVSERICTHRYIPIHLSTWHANTWTWVGSPESMLKIQTQAVHACDPSLGEDWGAETEGALEVTGQLAKQTSGLQVKWKTLPQKIREGSSRETDINLRVPHSWAYICTKHIYNSKKKITTIILKSNQSRQNYFWQLSFYFSVPYSTHSQAQPPWHRSWPWHDGCPQCFRRPLAHAL